MELQNPLKNTFNWRYSRNYIILFIYFLFFCPSHFGQKRIKITSKYLHFEDATSKEPILVYNDSMAVSGPDFSHHFKINFPKELILSDFNYNKYQIDGINYFVDDGGGIVLKFTNNTFKRIDNSFKHRNQFYGIPFVHQKTMYLWGGYGLFTYKNILTYYDFLGGEWLKKNQVNLEQVRPRSGSFYIIKDNNLYFFGGNTKLYHKEITSKKIKFNHVWRLSFKDYTLYKLPQYDNTLEFIKNHSNNYSQFQMDDKIIHISDVIREIDIFNNSVKTYAIKKFKAINNVLYHKDSKNISYTYKIDKNSNGIIHQPYKEFRGDLIKEAPFYEDSFVKVLLKYILYIVGLLIAVFGFKYIYQKQKKNKLKISYSKQKNTFYCKITPIPLNNLSALVLSFFLERQSEYFSINELNDTLSSDLESKNYITINKRRERVLRELTIELSNVLKVPKEHIFLYRKNKFDKRLKEIKLNITINIKN